MKKWWSVLLLLLFVAPVQAATRDSLIARLNEYLSDTTNRWMSSAHKLQMLDATGRELGRRGLYVKRDTIVTVANTESYTIADSALDFAGALQGAYLKRGQTRVVLPVIDRDSAFRVPDVKPGVISYLFVEEDGKLGTLSVPLRADTLILLYYAVPAALAEDTTTAGAEWALPDFYEDAALRITASKCLLRMQTTWALERSALLYQTGWADIESLKMFTPQSRQVGDAPR